MLRRRRRGALAPTLAILGVLIVLVLVLASVWTDVLWYRQLGFLQVYRTEMLTKAALFVVGGLLMAGGVLASLVVAYRARPIYAPVSPEQAALDRYRDGIEPLRRLVVIAVPAALGLFAGSAATQEWETLLLWWNRVSFGTKDKQFGLDVGFYVFTLPWLQFLVSFTTAVVFFSGLAAVVTHYLYGGLRLQGAGQRLLPAARMHLGLIIAVFLLLRGVSWWLGRYALTTRESARITGLTYTDANAVLTSRAVLAAIAIIVAVLFVVAAFVDGWRALPLYGTGLLLVSAIVLGGIYPAVVQRFQVKPNELTLETPYIERNIQATRAAYGLSDIVPTSYEARTTAEPGALRNDADTVPGIRLLDPALVSDAFRQLEQNKQYYAFPDALDVDRYKINGRLNDTVVAVRELNPNDPSRQRNWVTDHIIRTHGFGAVAAYGNQRSSDGKPVFFQSGIPSVGQLGDYEPRVYFGEQSPEYSIVGAPSSSAPVELDYPDNSATGQHNTIYTGNGGVAIGSLFNRLLYAIKFREQNFLLSDFVNADSKILYDRQPRMRVQKVAPFLTLDGDPYPAVVDHRIVWIVDGYTTTDRYPYSSTQPLQDATQDSLTSTRRSVVALQPQNVNYMRNSVKATVDAYDGRVSLYAWDTTDPILRAWQKIFPGAMKPITAMSGDLMSHVRYPEDLFKVQRDLLQQYHVQDGEAFFGEQDFWKVPDDPTQSGQTQLQPPYYLTLQMPGATDGASFSLTSTFIPTGGQRQVLTGFLAVDSNAGSTAGQRSAGYGKLRLLELPRDAVVPAPGQVQNQFNADPSVTRELNLLRGGASSVEYGNLLTLPVGGGLLYVQPVYVRGAGANTFPLLQRVLVAFGTKIGFDDTLGGALDQVFGGNATGTGSGTGTGGGVGNGPGSPTPTPSPSTATTTPPAGAQAQLDQALQDASQALKDSDAALAARDFTAYGDAQRRLNDAVQRAVAAEALLNGAPTASPSPSASPSASPTK